MCIVMLLIAFAEASKRRELPRQRLRVEGLSWDSLPSSINCSWHWLEQPLDHFARGASPSTYLERLCVYDSFYANGGNVLLYVGNESPVEEYVNATGLMWEVGRDIGAALVFAEHRYEGASVPNVTGLENCLSYCTVEQALADYAVVTEWIKKRYHGAKIVAVGGSYGGMLAAWFRLKYPSAVVGAIAGSAPIWGFPLLDETMDGSAVAVARSFGTAGGQSSENCRQNLLGAWPFIASVGGSDQGLQYLADKMGLCGPPLSGIELANAIQSVFFDLAEANYPFPSTYVTAAVGQGQYPLPAWPVRAACDLLADDLFVDIDGDIANVKFTAKIDNLTIDVDWDNIVEAHLDGFATSTNLSRLLQGVARVWSVWCNVSGTLDCLDPAGCTTGRRRLADDTSKACSALSYHGGSWGPLCCNDDLNLVNYVAQGIGRDALFWPPNLVRNASLEDVIGADGTEHLGCDSPDGLAGYPVYADPWSHWMVDQFGDKTAAYQTSNIVFSNGLLDPWSAAGVYTHIPDSITTPILVQNLTDSIQALILDLGAHHLDLMFLSDDDPDCAKQARHFEADRIRSWLQLEHDSRYSEYVTSQA